MTIFVCRQNTVMPPKDHDLTVPAAVLVTAVNLRNFIIIIFQVLVTAVNLRNFIIIFQSEKWCSTFFPDPFSRKTNPQYERHHLTGPDAPNLPGSIVSVNHHIVAQKYWRVFQDIGDRRR